MPTRATASLLSVFLLSLLPTALSAAYLTAAFSRRVLHQPFFPADPSQPPSQPPTASPPTSPKYPFSGSTTPDRSPFFPAEPSPPSPPPPSSSSSAAGLTSAPVNISSLAFPRSASSHRALPSTLIVITAALALCAVSLIVVSLLFYLRSRRRHQFSDDHEEKSAPSRSDRTRPSLTTETPTLPPKPRNSSNNSSEFLYLGTLANPRGVDGAVNNGGAARRGNGVGGFEPRKLDSPELHPLPPLVRQSMRQNVESRFAAAREDEEESYYSPRGSTSGRESSLAAGSGSRRVFAAVQAGRNESSDSTSSSGSSSSDTCSPARSASLSISPPASASPKSSKTKSPDFIVETQALTTSIAPPSPQLPPMSFGHPAPPPKEEAEDSPLLINGSNSSQMSSPVESPRLSPLRAIGGRISPAPARDWLGYDRNQLSPASDGSISSRKSSSIKLPRFLGGGSRKYSPESSSPHSISSPISPTISTASRSSSSRISKSVGPNGGSYPSSPSLHADSGRRRHSTPASPNLSGRHLQSTPASPAVSSRRIQPSSPELHRLSNVSDHNRMAPLVQPQAPAAPAPPPPPPAMRRSESPVSQTPVGGKMASNVGATEATPKPKLKPLHWDKVRASSDCEMVWDQLKCSSFKVNEEMIETLFVVNNPNPKLKDSSLNPVQPSHEQENLVLDPKKAQNIAILLRALNVSAEEVCGALLEGNARALGTELLESLLKMAPSKEEEWKLKEYKDDSPRKLGHAEKFLKTLIDIPFAFKRVEAMLYVADFETEVEYLKKSFETLEAACDELRNSRMFLKLLEAVLKTGNRMNVGTNRGDAQAFKLDTLLKLVDVKGADGKTTLLHFVVQEIIRAEGARHCNVNQTPQQPITTTDDAKCIKLGLQVVSGLSSELANVKKAAGMDSDALSSEVTKLSRGLAHIDEVVRLNEMTGPRESSRKFSESMNVFMRTAEEETTRVQAHERVALSLVKEITEYFHGNSAKEEAHPFRIFMVVRDFLAVLDRACKEVGATNERMAAASAHRVPMPVSPMLPVPVNPTIPQDVNGFQYGMHS